MHSFYHLLLFCARDVADHTRRVWAYNRGLYGPGGTENGGPMQDLKMQEHLGMRRARYIERFAATYDLIREFVSEHIMADVGRRLSIGPCGLQHLVINLGL